MLVNSPSFLLEQTTEAIGGYVSWRPLKPRFQVVRKGVAARRIVSGRAGRGIGDATRSNV